MDWWVWLIIIGAIFLLSIGVLIWIIVVSNKLVILKNAVDRNFPVINSKIKQYCEKVNELVDYVDKKINKEDKKGISLKKSVKECLENEGMINRAIAQKQIAEKANKYIEDISKLDCFKGNKKLDREKEDLVSLQELLNISIEKYNLCVEEYNKLRESFPSNMISERFKFGARNKWNI